MAEYQRKGTRDALAEAMLEHAEADARVVLVSSDSLKALRADSFPERFPDRFFEIGISEQASVNFSVGLAAAGLRPVYGTYAGFITMRACEQLRTFAAYTGMPVVFVGLNGGLYGGEREGVTHQFFEDLAITRAIPGMTVLVPCDALQTKKALAAALKIDGPVYIRIGSGKERILTEESDQFRVGDIRPVRSFGNDLAVFACGPLLYRAMEAADELFAEGIKITVYDVPTLKPLNAAQVAEALQRCGRAITFEDHNVIGGLGSAIGEISITHCPVKIDRLGLQDVFPESGPAEELTEKYGMGRKDLVDMCRKAMAESR